MARLLIVEDNPDNLKLFRALLTRQGHQLTELTTGRGLVDAVRRAAPDLVLLDIQLPERDGFELLAELRAAFGRGLRVVALTANALEEREAAGLGFDGLLTKPIDVGSFPDRIARLLEGQ
ncbi:MAG: response regulator [Gemmatimonadales bacterium]